MKNNFPEFNHQLDKYSKFIADGFEQVKRGNKKKPKAINHRSPAVLYNQMIRPLMPFAIRGVIWYQGESNVEKTVQYRKLFPAMIQNWRDEWKQGDFPFYFVQIAPFAYKANKLPVALLREAQTYALELPSTGMVVTMDVGDATNIHPKVKKPVGERLARLALAKDYGKTELVYSGPEFEAAKTEKDKIRLTFKHVGGGPDQPRRSAAVSFHYRWC